ncbi:hypothetical protein GM415_08990 [Pseudodesulfovibrio cashew]|uniref:Uncharacterized protein n=1 Tax=Pseudodesulfovibrio cashew TaxID=2678688 RepID=A0A6I6JJF8_9BACT|nr:hypothetical protein [Pseudodesulfovibrio cashew]QGY40257.1 hypothetical protein GM415_08990 [Pseudodesulfovibrio cashew]
MSRIVGQVITVVSFCLFLLVALPAAALDGGGDGGGGDGGGGGNDGSSMSGNMVEVDGWTKEVVKKHKSEVNSFLAQRKKDALSMPRNRYVDPADPDYVVLEFLMTGMWMNNEPLGEESLQAEEEEWNAEDHMAEEQVQASRAELEEFSRVYESIYGVKIEWDFSSTPEEESIGPRNPAPETGSNPASPEEAAVDPTDQHVADAIAKAPLGEDDTNEIPTGKISQDQLDEITANLSDKDKEVAKQMAEAYNKTKNYKPVSQERYDEILSNAPDEIQEGLRNLTDNNFSMRMDEDALLGFVQKANEDYGAYEKQKGDEAYVVEKSLEAVDETGQASQNALSFVPGVGWGWSTTLDGLRAGAEANKKGADWKGIIAEVVKKGGVSYVTNRAGGGNPFSNSKNVKGAAADIFSKEEDALGYAKQLAGYVAGQHVNRSMDNQVAPRSRSISGVDMGGYNGSVTTRGGHNVMK